MTLFYRITGGIRVTVRPEYLPERSRPALHRFVFTYRVRLENVGDEAARLLWRHWYIHDPAGGDTEVEGEGVVGETPMLRPGQVYEYQSFCVLNAPDGYMEGYYLFERSTGTTFRVRIPRFVLHAGPATPPLRGA